MTQPRVLGRGVSYVEAEQAGGGAQVGIVAGDWLGRSNDLELGALEDGPAV